MIQLPHRMCSEEAARLATRGMAWNWRRVRNVLVSRPGRSMSGRVGAVEEARRGRCYHRLDRGGSGHVNRRVGEKARGGG